MEMHRLTLPIGQDDEALAGVAVKAAVAGHHAQDAQRRLHQERLDVLGHFRVAHPWRLGGEAHVFGLAEMVEVLPGQRGQLGWLDAPLEPQSPPLPGRLAQVTS
jgi:hypothetical protein